MSEQEPNMWDEIARTEISMGSGPAATKAISTPLEAIDKDGTSYSATDADSRRIATPRAEEHSDETYARMLREIRSWGLWSLALGALHLVASGFLSTSWGVLLLVVGLASFYFREAAMFVVYGVTLAWAGISNMLGGDVVWIGFAIIQFIMAFQVFRRFFHFRRAQAELVSISTTVAHGSSQAPVRGARIFPWAGGLLGALALGGLVSVVVWLFLYAVFTESTELPDFFGLLASFVLDLGILGAAVSLASLLSGYRYKLVSIFGLVTSALVPLVWFVLVLAP